MDKATVEAATADLAHLVDRVESGEEIILMRGARAVARLIPVRPVSGKRQFGALKGKVDIGQEFFDPLPEDELRAWE